MCEKMKLSWKNFYRQTRQKQILRFYKIPLLILLIIILYLIYSSYNILITDHPERFRLAYFNTFHHNLNEEQVNEEQLWISKKQAVKMNSLVDCDTKVQAIQNSPSMDLTIPESFIVGALFKTEHRIQNDLLKSQINVKMGGSFKPKDCWPRESVAILIPYRKRQVNLLDFLHYMHIFLQKQLRYYRIYILEQGNDLPFNRAKLFNAGVREIWKKESQENDFKPDCFILHDIDKLPHSLDNIYECAIQSPRQYFLQYYDKAGYFQQWTSYYKYFFGGITSFTKWQILKMNGASNNFYGWGGEDDDLFARSLISGMNPAFVNPIVGRYWIRDHGNDMREIKDRYYMLKYYQIIERMKYQGIRQVQYIAKQYSTSALYTKIVLDV